MSSKSITIIILTFLFSMPVFGQGERTIELCISNTAASVRNGTHKTIMTEGMTQIIGRYSDVKYRAFYQWELPENIIPDGSNITSARFYISYYSSMPSHLQMHGNIFSVELDLDSATPQQLWDRTDTFNNKDEYRIGSIVGENFEVDYSYQDGDDFCEAIEEALEVDFFTLGIINNRELLHEYEHRFDKGVVFLEIKYTLPLINITVDQKRSDGTTSVGSIRRWENGSIFQNYNVPAPFDFYVSDVEVLQAMQTMINDPNEKYHDWNISANVANHQGFIITNSTSDEWISQFEWTYSGVTIKNDLSGLTTENIEFKDPWFIDYADPIYGNVKRNR